LILAPDAASGLFALLDEAIACMLRADTDYVGIALPDPVAERRIKISQYADDKNNVMSNDHDAQALLRHFGTYEAASGAKINYNKSCVMLVGGATAAHFPSLPFHILGENETTKHLGFTVGLNVTDRDIWLQCLGKFVRTLRDWSRRDLSVQGRITVLTSLACSKLWYFASTLSVPKDIADQINSSCWKFLWKNKRSGPIARAKCLSPKSEGGLSMLDPECMIRALQFSNLKRLLDDEPPSWQPLVADDIRSHSAAEFWKLGLRLILSDVDVRTKMTLASPFWHFIMRTAQFLNINESPPKTVEQVLRQQLFYNGRILENGVSLSGGFQHVARKGHLKIGHILHLDLSPASSSTLQIQPQALTRILNAIPQEWTGILAKGYLPPKPNEWFVLTRALPPKTIYRVDRLQHNGVVMSCFKPSQSDPSIVKLVVGPSVWFSLDGFPMYRAKVIAHLDAWRFVGLEDDLDFDIDTITVDQRLGSKIIKTKLADSTVKGTRELLTHTKSKSSNASQLWPGVIQPTQWRKIWPWIWHRYRNKKIADFLWKLFHKALYLGWDRRRYSNDTNCPLCPNKVETYEHFLQECPASQSLWDWFKHIWQKSSDLLIGTSLTDRLLCSVARRLPKSSHHRWIIFSILHGEILYTLWIQRCRALFDEDKTQMSSDVLIAVARHRINIALNTVKDIYKLKSDKMTKLIKRILNTMERQHHVPVP
jgi:hypothetical protein